MDEKIGNIRKHNYPLPQFVKKLKAAEPHLYLHNRMILCKEWSLIVTKIHQKYTALITSSGHFKKIFFIQKVFNPFIEGLKQYHKGALDKIREIQFL